MRGALAVTVAAAPPLRQKSFCKIFLASAEVDLIALPVVNARASCLACFSEPVPEFIKKSFAFGKYFSVSFKLLS